MKDQGQTRKDQPIRIEERTSNHSPDNDQLQFRCDRAADLRKLTSRSSYCRFPPYLGCPRLVPGSGGRVPGEHPPCGGESGAVLPGAAAVSGLYSY